MNKRRNEAESLLAAQLAGAFEGMCVTCGKTDVIVAFDSCEAATAFYEDGWRVINNELLCKKCRRKK